MSLIYTSPISRNNIYLGGKVDAKSFSTLKQRNVLRILNVTPAKEAGISAGVPNYFENSKGGMLIKYKRIPVYDSSTSDLISYADEVVNFISSGLHHGSVLVHCQKGVSRSATAVIFYLIRKANMTYEQALKLCKQRRSTVDPIPAFCDQLQRYEQECRKLGYLTATNNQNADDTKQDGSSSVINVSAKNQSSGSGSKQNSVKRKVEASGDTVAKRQMIGPSRPVAEHSSDSIPSRVIGPSIGPSRPDIAANPSKKTAPIGPQRPPNEEAS